jgi:hypothetical protein
MSLRQHRAIASRASKEVGGSSTRATNWQDFARRDAPAMRLSAMSDDPAIRHETIARIFVTTLALCALFMFAVSVLIT